MKYLILMLSIMLVVGVTAVNAEDVGTSRGIYSVPSSQGFEDFLNETGDFQHNHVVTEEKVTEIETGYGVDLKVPLSQVSDSKIFKVLEGTEIQYRFNNRDKEHSVYSVAQINLLGFWKK